MAYETIYTAGWQSKNRQGLITIKKKDYIGSPTFTLLCKAESLQVDYMVRGWEEPVVGLNASFTFQNSSVAMSARLLMLMNAEEREYKVIITVSSPSSYTLFEGFLNCETFQQPYVGYGSLTLTASNYLSKLKYKYPDSIDTLQNLSFIELLDDILVQSGAGYNIRVNCSIEETTYPLSSDGTETALDSYGVYTEFFWKNNIDRDNGLEILRILLSSYECYIYWYDGYWYIERYEDIWSTDKNFVEYETGASNINGSGVVVNETPASSDLHDLVWQELTQMLSVIPGKNKIEINLKETRFYNLTINDFSDAEEITTLPMDYDPGWRKWAYYDDEYSTWPDKDISYKNISKGIQRTGTISGSYAKGLYTKVKVTIGTTTSISLKWKFAMPQTTVPGNMVVPEDTNVTFRWFMKVGTEFIMQNVDSDNSWKLTSGATTYSGKENEIEITGEDFDQELWSYECQVTVPLYEVEGLAAGETDIVVIIGKESFEYDGTSENSSHCVIGDVKITVSETPPDNMIEGQVTNDYLEELKIEMPLFDLATRNYKNGILCDTDFEELSTQWTDGDHTETLARMKLITKWRQYHKTMQQVSGDIFSYVRFRPFQMFTDSEQSRVFILGSFTDYADQDKKQIELMEYDNTEVITLS